MKVKIVSKWLSVIGSVHCSECWTHVRNYDMQSLSGHTSPVHAVALNQTENAVGTGAFSGVLKIWDLENNKRKSSVQFSKWHRKYITMFLIRKS